MSEGFYRRDKIRKFERTSTMEILVEKRKRFNKLTMRERL